MITILGSDIINGLDYRIKMLREKLIKVTDSSSDYRAAIGITDQIVKAYEARASIAFATTYTVSEAPNED